jgi:hypothetical protein
MARCAAGRGLVPMLRAAIAAQQELIELHRERQIMRARAGLFRAKTGRAGRNLPGLVRGSCTLKRSGRLIREALGEELPRLGRALRQSALTSFWAAEPCRSSGNSKEPAPYSDGAHQ